MPWLKGFFLIIDKNLKSRHVLDIKCYGSCVF